MQSNFIPGVTQEECAEVIQAISKVLRFGLNQKHPATGMTNKQHLEQEFGQLLYMLHLLEKHYSLDSARMYAHYRAKKEKLEYFTQFEIQPEPKAEQGENT